MSVSPSQRPTIWPCNERYPPILLKIPKTIDLGLRSQSSFDGPVPPTNPDRNLTSSTPYLSNLPTELFCEIFAELASIDQVCLALTCKSLCLEIISSPRPSPVYHATWSPPQKNRMGLSTTTVVEDDPLELLDECYRPFHKGRDPDPVMCFMSEQLKRRLARGWIPRDTLRYCHRCHLILPRSETYWWKKLDSEKERPAWSPRVRCERAQWMKMSKKQRHAWLIQSWCEGRPHEYNQCLCCDDRVHHGMTIRCGHPFIPKYFNYRATARRYRGRLDESIDRVYLPVVGVGGGSRGRKKLDRMDYHSSRLPDDEEEGNLRYRLPLQCPGCMQKELTFKWRPQRKPFVVMFVKDCCNLVLDLGVKLFYGVAVILAGIFVIVQELYRLGRLIFRLLRTSLTR